jgi:hypothetical protein
MRGYITPVALPVEHTRYHPADMTRIVATLLALALGAGCLCAQQPAMSPDETLASLRLPMMVSMRLRFMEHQREEVQARYADVIRYLKALELNPGLARDSEAVARDFGPQAAILNRALASACFGQPYLGNDADEWVRLCPPAFWTFMPMSPQSREAQKTIYTDYWLAFANADRHSEADWEYLVQSVLQYGYRFKDPVAALSWCHILLSAEGETRQSLWEKLKDTYCADPTNFRYAALPLIEQQWRLPSMLSRRRVEVSNQFRELTDSGLKLSLLNTAEANQIFSTLFKEYQTRYTGTYTLENYLESIYKEPKQSR